MYLSLLFFTFSLISPLVYYVPSDCELNRNMENRNVPLLSFTWRLLSSSFQDTRYLILATPTGASLKKKICFRWTGRVSKKVRLGTFFFIFAKKEKMDNIFLPKKHKFFGEKKKKIAAAQLATITATRWTGNRLFFVDSLGKGIPTKPGPNLT